MNGRERAYNNPGYALKVPSIEKLPRSMPAKIGVMAPDFAAPTLEGRVVRLKDLRGKRYVVLMMGSITSPTCVANISAMNKLHKELHPRSIDFYLVYTREAHPGERYPRHTSRKQKFSHARDLARLENVRFPILVDSLDGKIHKRYGLWPVSLFVISRDGRLVYRSNIAYPAELRSYLEELIRTDDLEAKAVRVIHPVYSERLIEREADRETHRRVYERAGAKAFEDYWKRNPALRGRWP